MSNPVQIIHVEIPNVPEWADIYVTNPDLYIHVFYGSEVYEANTNLVIRPKVNAPHEMYQLNLNAYCEDLGRIKGHQQVKGIFFTPLSLFLSYF